MRREGRCSSECLVLFLALSAQRRICTTHVVSHTLAPTSALPLVALFGATRSVYPARGLAALGLSTLVAPAPMDVSVTFDEEGQVRVLPADKALKTQQVCLWLTRLSSVSRRHRLTSARVYRTQIETSCTAFVSKIEDFYTSVGGLVNVLDSQAKKIEHEKLKVSAAAQRCGVRCKLLHTLLTQAIGKRNQIEREVENRYVVVEVVN